MTRAGRALAALLILCGAARAASAVSFAADVLVAAGDVIDFAVGFGPNGSFNNDTTGLAATITLGGVGSDVATDFSASDNPNGVWQYGWSATLGSSFVLSTHPAVRDGIDTWRGDLAADGNPAAYHNGTGGLVVLGNTARIEAGQFALHPGPGGELAVARYVATEAGIVSITSSFTGLDVFGTTTDVHVLLNGTSLFDGLVVSTPEAGTSALLGGSALAFALVKLRGSVPQARRRRRRRIAARLFAVSLALAPAVGAGATSFTTLPFSAYDVSGDGSVVVGTSSGLAVRWTEAGGFQYLGSGEALGVSADGSVVVGGVYSGSSYQAFRWTQSGGRTTIGLGQALDASSDGSVVVGTMPLGGTGQAFRWTETDGMVALGILPGSSATQAAAVSADGSVVVGSGNYYEPFRWTESEGMISLGFLGESYAYATGVSADGAAVFGCAQTPAGDFDGFRWTETGGMVGLGFPSQGFAAHCDVGEVIPSADGSILVGDGAGVIFDDSAFIWDATHGVRSLRQLLIDAGIDLSGWTLDNVAAISDDGRTIVGYGTNPNGQQEHWLAVLPEPSTGLLLLLGLAGVAGWRRRLV